IKKVQVSGGIPVELAKTTQPFGATWTGDRIFVGAGPGGILELSQDGGAPRVVVAARADRNESLHGPQLLPDGTSVVFTLKTGGSSWDTASIVVEDLVNHERRVIVQVGTDGRYLDTGHLVYARDNALYAIAFDPRRAITSGTATNVVSGVVEAGAGNTGAAQYTVSANGSLVYLPGSVSSRTLYWRGREGEETVLSTPPHSYGFPRISPDGTRIAVDNRDGIGDIWIWDSQHEA